MHVCLQEASVAYMAKAVSGQWQRSLAFHLHTVTQPNPDVDLHHQADTLLQQVCRSTVPPCIASL